MVSIMLENIFKQQDINARGEYKCCFQDDLKTLITQDINFRRSLGSQLTASRCTMKSYSTISDFSSPHDLPGEIRQ